ncbi:MAG: hypothetical protein WKH97_07000 [Casimicrobiaceae bacterium]
MSLNTNPTNFFGVLKLNPAGAGDNPAYRNHVSTLMLAYTLGKPITFFVDGCISGVPRVVVMRLLP